MPLARYLQAFVQGGTKAPSLADGLQNNASHSNPVRMHAMAHSSFVELSSPRFDAAHTRADLVRVRITRTDIASGRVGPVVDQLMQLSDSPQGVERWKDKLIIGIEKSPADVRDASEIAEVVHYFRQVTVQWPFWAHFAEKECGTIGAVLRLLIGTERIRKDDGSEAVTLTDADEVRAKSKWLFAQMKHLYRCHGLPETEDVEAARAMTRAVNAMFQKT